MTVKVGVYGATGYTGLELVGLLEKHPGVEIVFLTSESSAGQSLRSQWPFAPDMTLVSSAEAPLGDVDGVFLCLPHTKSAPLAVRALAAGVKVVDLSADLRVDDPAVYEKYYKVPHPAPELLPVPYGIPELNRDQIIGGSCVAAPGCYPTSVLLPSVPLVRAGVLVDGAPLIADSKSGISGAGRTAKVSSLFCEIHGNFSPYNIGQVHRHMSEMHQEIDKAGQFTGQLIFSPHLIPTDRGILTTLYAQVTDMDAALQAITEIYAGEPLVNVLPAGELATLRHVVRTPYAAISLTPVTDDLLVAVCTIDNLLKGAASQAVQDFNLLFDLPETAGLV